MNIKQEYLREQRQQQQMLNEIVNLADIRTFYTDFKQYKKSKTDIQTAEKQILLFIQKFYKKDYERLRKQKITKKEVLKQTYAFNNGYNDLLNYIDMHRKINKIKKGMIYSNIKSLHKYINIAVLKKMLYGDREDIEELKAMNLNISALDYIKKGIVKYVLALKGYRYLHEITGYGINYQKFYEMNSNDKNEYLLKYIQEIPQRISTSQMYRMIYNIVELRKADIPAIKTLIQIIQYEHKRLKIIRRFKQTKKETAYETKNVMTTEITKLYQKFKNDAGAFYTLPKSLTDKTTVNKIVQITAIPEREKKLLKWYIQNTNRLPC